MRTALYVSICRDIHFIHKQNLVLERMIVFNDFYHRLELA